MHRRSQSYLRTHRKRWGLSCKELALLLGISPDAVSKYELGKRPIPTRVLIACELLFGVPGVELFPALYANVRNTAAHPAQSFAARYEHREDASGKRKCALIAGALTRLSLPA